VIIKGKSVGGARRLAVHLTRTDTNERAEVKELRGVVADDLRGALLEMEAVAAGTRTTKPFYHASINTLAHERLTDEQRMYAVEKLEAALGLTGQARGIIVHEKEGREHCHIVWSRIDLDRMAAISDSHNYRKHEEVARALEREFGHERVQGAHAERDGKERPERTPSHAEMLQADRTGLSPKQVKEQITELWRQTHTGQAFAVALWQAGYVLARGDRRDYVVIDPQGGTHSLARRVDGARVKDIRERMSDLESTRLPGIADAKQIQRARQARDAAREREGLEPLEPTQGLPAPSPKEPRPAAREPTRGDEKPGLSPRAVDGAARAIGSLFDGIASIFERGLSGGGDVEADAEKEHAPPPDQTAEQPPQSVLDDEQKKADSYHERLREFGRQILSEQEAEFERDRDRDRSR